MELINNLLKNYYKKINQQQLVIQIIIKEINNKTGLDLTNEEIKLKDSVVYLKTKPKKKIEIFIKKELIIQELNNLGIKVSQIV